MRLLLADGKNLKLNLTMLYLKAVNAEAPQGMGGKASTTGVLNVHRSTTNVKDDYYSLSGVRLTAQTAQGPCIAVSRGEDGAVVARKIVVRH